MTQGVQDEISAEDRVAFAIDFTGGNFAVKVAVPSRFGGY
jgi:hypothetical protein